MTEPTKTTGTNPAERTGGYGRITQRRCPAVSGRQASQAGGEICGRMAILAEGDAQQRPDIIYLEKLPLFHPDGTVMG